MAQPTSALRYGLPLALLISLSACQRASYLFQPPAPGLAEVATAPPAGEPAPAPEARPAAVAASELAPRLRQQGVRRQHYPRRAARLPGRLPARWARPGTRAAQLVRLVAPAFGGAAAAESAPQHARGVAFLLAFFAGLVGAHLFYLGYTPRATWYAFVGGLSLLLLFIFANTSGRLTFGIYLFGILSVLGLAIIGLLTLIDIIGILTKQLKPKEGEYKSGFF